MHIDNLANAEISNVKYSTSTVDIVRTPNDFSKLTGQKQLLSDYARAFFLSHFL